MEKKLFDGELKLMELLWEQEPVSAKELSAQAGELFGWNKNTTYTVLKRLEAKGFIKRNNPGFVCVSLLSQKDARKAETRGIIDKFFGGSRKALFSALIEDEALSAEEIEALRQMIEKR